MKPILFNTKEVQASLDGRKTAARRVVKPQPHVECDHGGQHEFIRDDFTGEAVFTGFVCKKCGYGVCGPHFKFPVGTSWLRPPYSPGDILYVRETWATPYGGEYRYRADYKDHDIVAADRGNVSISANMVRWRPSIHMPKEAARMFGRVTGLRVQRVQDTTDEEARREGCADRADFHRVWNDCYAKPRPVKGEDGEIDHYESWPWEDIRETRTYKGKPWYVIGNPWVWVTEFERITKAEVN